MARWFNWFKRKGPSEKQFKTLAAILEEYRDPNLIGDDYQTQASEGYLKNVIAYRAITGIARAVAGIPYVIKQDEEELDRSHPISKLIRRPNPGGTFYDLLREIIMHRMISGNCYLQGIQVSSGAIKEIYPLRPDRVKIRSTITGIPVAYDYTIGGRTESFPIDPKSRVSDVLHMKEPNPLNDLYGLSPVRAAALGISQHNSSAKWNVKLLENAAKPPGIISIKSEGAGSVAPDQATLNKLAEDFNSKYSGFQNAGRIPFLAGGLEWQQMGMSPDDMDWINGKNSSARDVALAFGYPPFLLGLPEGATFSNVADARLFFYIDTVIPLANETHCAISHWLSQKMLLTEEDGEIEITPDLDSVEALAPMREKMWEQSRKDFEAGLITPNEARAQRNYDPLPAGGDDVLIPAAKLPLGFDPSSLTDEQYQQWLMKQGVPEEMANKIVEESR